ncbi:YabP/YqfC family sporulation protein [Ihubacter sp. rT4E-8]|uniref:YabP/YqfC family sporulation protein n=1 Tax=unclassified Ihubacter TaxID=2633299 RepID=UPI00137A2F0E
MENHYIQMDNRKRITVTEVTSVEGFDEETILTNLIDQGLVISGKNLHIEALDLDEGKLVAEGEIEGINYTKKKSGGNIFDKLRRFRK